MEVEHNEVKSTRRVKVSPKITHKRLLDRITKLSQSGIERFYYHYLVPGLNMSLQESKLEDFVITPGIQCTTARPLYVTSNSSNTIDLCHRRVAISQGFNYKIRYNASIFEKYLKKKDFRKAMKNGTFPAAVIRAMNLRKAHPYPYFNGDYDWYFTGGNLACFNGYLVSVKGSNMDILDISSIKKNSLKNIFQIEYNKQEENAPTSEILEIQESFYKDKFIIRCEKNITKYSYEDCKASSLYNIHRNNIPFITFCEDPFNENIILTGDLNRQVLIWDINYSVNQPLSKLISQNDNILERSDNWNIIRHFNNSYAFADFEKFALIDSRDQCTAEEIKFSTLKENIGICENISSLSVSNKYANIIYIGTTHKIFAIDARYLNKNSKKSLLLKWTHQLKYPPLILKTHNCTDFELIAASSPLNGEICLFEVKQTKSDIMKTKYISSFLPISPPNLMESFYFTKLQGDCLNPLVNFESRLKKCTTGITFFEQNDKLQLIIENSIGDILACKITNNEENESSKKYNCDIIKNYYNAVKEKTEGNSRELFVTDIKNMKNFSKVLRCEKLSSNEEFRKQYNNLSQSENFAIETSNANDNSFDDFPIKTRKLWKWEKPPTQYAQCKDVLASNLLQVWEFDMDETEGKKLFEKSSKLGKELTQSRVNDWVENIQKTYYKNNIFSGEVIEDIILTEEIYNSSDKYQSDQIKPSYNDSSNIYKTNFKSSCSIKTQPTTLNKKIKVNSDKNNQNPQNKTTNKRKITEIINNDSSDDNNLPKNYKNTYKNYLLNETATKSDKLNETLPKITQQQSLIDIETQNLSNNSEIEKLTRNSGTQIYKEKNYLFNVSKENKMPLAKKKRQYVKGF